VIARAANGGVDIVTAFKQAVAQLPILPRAMT
jgi:hypothetical protein